MQDSINEFLISEMSRRSRHNPSYSMRAFARDLELTPSHLSNLFKGKSGLSRKSAIRITQNLKWSSNKSKIFIETVESKYSRCKALRQAAVIRVEKLSTKQKLKENLKVDEFQFIANWYHLAILELFELKQFKMNDNFIAEKLGIGEEEVKLAVSRLLRLKLLKVKKGKLTPSEDDTLVGDHSFSLAVREFHTQLIKKASEAITKQDINERILRSTIFAIKKDKISEALTMLQEFHSKFCEQLGEGPGLDKDEVYCLTSQFFRLTLK